MIVFESPVAAALNHLLEAEPWARERLAPFAGETLELRLAPLPALKLAIASQGTLRPAAEAASASLTLTLGPDALAALPKGEDHFLRAIEISGNEKLAHEVLYLFRHLRWDAEEDLARLIGDAAAHRVAGVAREFAGWQQDAVRRLAESLMAYAVEEKQLLLGRAALEELAEGIARLRDALARLEKRLERLAR